VRTVVALVGLRRAGKTTALQGLAERLRSAGLRVGGIVQPAIHEGGERVGYDVLDLASGERRALARRGAQRRPDGCGYVFEAGAWSWAAERLRAARRECDVLVADELGHVEAAGDGHLPALLGAGDDRARLWLLGVRQEAGAALEERLGAFDLTLTPAVDVEALAGRLLRTLA
jgi:nucleoside-triphosphatase